MNVVNGKAAKILTVLNKFRYNSLVPRIPESSSANSPLTCQFEGKKVNYSYCSSNVYNKNSVETLNNPSNFLGLNKVEHSCSISTLTDLNFNEEQYRRWYGVIHQYKSTRRSCYHLQQSLAEWYARPGQYGQFLAQDRILREYISSFFGGYHEFRIIVGDVFVARSHGKIFLSGSYFKSAFDEWHHFFRGKSVKSMSTNIKWLHVLRRHIGHLYLQDKSTTVAWYSTLQWLQIQCPARAPLSLQNVTERFVNGSDTNYKYRAKRQFKIASMRQEFSILNRLIESEYTLICEQNDVFDNVKWLPWGWQSLKPKQSWVRPVFLENNIAVRKNRLRSTHRRVQFTVRLPMLGKKPVGSSKHLLRSSKSVKLHPTQPPIFLSYGFISKHLKQALTFHFSSKSTVHYGVDNSVIRILTKLAKQFLKISEKQVPLISLGIYCSPMVSNVSILRNSLKKYWQVMTSRLSADLVVTSDNKELRIIPQLLILTLEKAFDSVRFTAAFNRLKNMLNVATKLKALSLNVSRRAGKFRYLQSDVSAANRFSAYINMFTCLKRYAITSQARVYPKLQYEDSRVLHFEQLYRQLEYATGCQVFLNMVSLRHGLHPKGMLKIKSSVRSLYRIFHQQFQGLSDQPGRLIWMEAAPAIILAPHKDANLLLKLIIRAFKLTNYRHYNRFLALVKRYMSSVLCCLGRQTGFQGFKLLINGKLKRNPRSVEERILLGRMPLQSADSRLVYSWQSVRRKRGVFGFKLWLYFGERYSIIIDKRKQFLLEQQQVQTPPQNRLNAISWEHVNRHMQTPFWDSIRSCKNVPKWN